MKQSLKPKALCILTILGFLLWQTLHAEEAEQDRSIMDTATMNEPIHSFMLHTIK